MFDQFYTEDKSRSSGNSQGVGLYVVDEIVKAHGGSVKVKSKKGKGSVFSVALPIEFDDSNRTFTAILDDMPRACKIILEIAFGGLMSIVYRIAKFTETLHVHTLVAGIACFGLFMFMWPLDVVSVIVYGKSPISPIDVQLQKRACLRSFLLKKHFCGASQAKSRRENQVDKKYANYTCIFSIIIVK